METGSFGEEETYSRKVLNFLYAIFKMQVMLNVIGVFHLISQSSRCY
jgi:hypothetical protein